MTRRATFAILAVACLLSRAASAQTPSNPSGPVGVWRGTSLCLVRPSPCKDETVVYRFARLGAADSLSLDARKIVNGKEEEMGVLHCRFTATRMQVDCVMPNGTWRFIVRGDSLVGELRLPDSTKYRDVRTARPR